MMRQFLGIKAQHPDAIVFYRMGDFYEMFLDDAERAAPILDIALTSRDKGKADPVPMCGVPVHSADQYVRRLVERGLRVAICEQVEDPKSTGGRKLVRREVIEVRTPGLVGDPEGLEGSSVVSIAAVSRDPDGTTGIAILDGSTGDFRATTVHSDGAPEGALPSALEELERVAPRELVTPAAIAEGLAAWVAERLPTASLTRDDESEGAGAPLPELGAIEGLAASPRDAGLRAAEHLARYLARHQPFALRHTRRLRRYALRDAMVLDAATRRHLELFESQETGSRRATLIERLDETGTPLGARRLARWLAYPLIDPDSIAERHDAVAFLFERDRLRGRIRAALAPVRDAERLLAKLGHPNASPRDAAALRASLEALPAVAEAVEEVGDGELPGAETTRPASLPRPRVVPDAERLLRAAIVDDPPAVPRGSRGALEVGYVRSGFRSELDGLRESASKGREWIAGLEQRERERTGISSLKVRFHPVHGYSIEVTRAQLAAVPASYERKQTLANAERFTIPELREAERNVVGAHEKAAALEREIFAEVRRQILGFAAPIQASADAVAELDALASLAEVARRERWVRPAVDASDDLEIVAGRHPVIEPLLARQGSDGFVPNDTRLSADAARIVVLTGPNMSGKSTYLRQVALIVLLAQLGSFVPAESARVGIVDRVFTRVGASDRLARGESTFMVEMRETAEILAQASHRSLVILDEIGRGTSTFDGLSIAWAVAEYLHDTPGLRPRTLFATHYHELTDLAATKDQVSNAHFEVREWQEEVIFLRRLVEGGASRSYGIQVARLAGLPSRVIERARAILANLESGELDAEGRPRLAVGTAGARGPGPGPDSAQGDEGPVPRDADPSDQLGLFARHEVERDPREEEVISEMRALDPDRTTPLAALEALARWQAHLRRDS